MLYSERNRRRERDEREAGGENLWTSEFSLAVRRKVAYVARDAENLRNNDYPYGVEYQEVEKQAINLILRAEGWNQLTIDSSTGPNYRASLWEFAEGCASDFYPTVIEALFCAIGGQWAGAYAKLVNEILRENRVAFELIDGSMIPIESQELHASVIRPTITLLSGRPGFEAIEVAYVKALDEIAKGDPGDSITDAGTALQQTLEALGCQGNALGPLIKDAKRRGLLLAHDSTLTDGIEKILHWVSADRSESGDAHKATTASIEDAWLTVHVVGALILRLADGPMRGVVGK